MNSFIIYKENTITEASFKIQIIKFQHVGSEGRGDSLCRNEARSKREVSFSSPSHSFRTNALFRWRFTAFDLQSIMITLLKSLFR